MRKCSRYLGICVFACFSSAAPLAADESYPRISGEVAFEIENDYVFEAEDSDAELNDLFATVEPSIRIEPVEHVAIVSGLVLEPVRDADDDRYFEDHGLYVEQLFLEYSDDWGRVFGGKFNPSFGVAWDLAPGIFGVDFAEDYELTEQLGGGVALGFGNARNAYLGVVEVSANIFLADRSLLSESVINGRGNLDLDEGGAGNTKGPGAFSLTLDGSDVAALPGLSYHLGLRFRAGGEDEDGDESGLVFGLVQAFEIDENQTFELIGEAAYFSDFDAGEEEAVYVTLGGAYYLGNWNVAVVGALRDTALGDSAVDTDHLAQVSAGYAFDFGLGFDLGYRYGREESNETHTLGALTSYTLEF